MSEFTVTRPDDRSPGMDARLARTTFLKVLERLESGRLELIEPDGQRYVRGTKYAAVAN